jgi:pheromone shutdown-related protein TraB
MSVAGNVTRLEYQGREIHLIGTAHVSKRSVEEVTRVIRDLRPDTVCVELDAVRYEAMTDEHRFRKLNIFQIIREKKVLFLLASLVLTSFQRRMGEKLGVKPGAELLAGVTAAEEVGAQLVLADRDIQATLKRSWANLGFWNKLQLLQAMVGSFFASNEITEEQIEELKDRDTINEMMGEFARHMPELQTPLIDERDRYLMSSIQEAPGRKIVAVVGAGHVTGMVGYLGATVDRDALTVIPKPSLLSRSLKWVIPTLMLSAFYWGYREHSGQGLVEMLYAWVLPNSIGAAVLAAVAGATPLTILTAAVASPITSLNPTIGAGMVAGLVEAWQRRPTVEDCEGINDAISSLRGTYRNPFTRVLLVAVGATLGSALGAYVGAAWVVKLL